MHILCQMQSKTENRVKRVSVYSDYLALQCGLTGYTIDTINGRHEKSCLPFLCLQLKFAAFGFVMRFIRVYKNGRCGEIPPCRKCNVLQFRFIYQSVANRLCVIVSASADLRKAVLFIQLFAGSLSQRTSRKMFFMPLFCIYL